MLIITLSNPSEDHSLFATSVWPGGDPGSQRGMLPPGHREGVPLNLSYGCCLMTFGSSSHARRGQQVQKGVTDPHHHAEVGLLLCDSGKERDVLH